MKKIIYLCFFLILLFVNCQIFSNDEKLEDWIFPQTDNFKLLNTEISEKGYENINLSTKIFYFKLPDNKFGTLEATFLNGVSGAAEGMMFDLKNDELLLIKEKNGGLNGMTKPRENRFISNNIYWKLPPKNDIAKWEYSIETGTIVNCSSYWISDENNLKILVVEREMFETKKTSVRFEKLKEYYKKNVGLFKIESYGKSDIKILTTSRLSESGIDPEVNPEKFSLQYD